MLELPNQNAIANIYRKSSATVDENLIFTEKLKLKIKWTLNKTENYNIKEIICAGISKFKATIDISK